RHQLLEHHPILQPLQLHRVVERIAAGQGVEVDLSSGAEVGTQLRVQVGGQVDLRQALEHLFAVDQVLRFVVENYVDKGKPGERDRTQVGQVWQPVQLRLDGNGDLLLHLLGGAPR